MPLERFKNPADSLLKKLSFNYPKQQADLDKIKFFLESYKELNEPKMLKEREEVTFEDLGEAIQNFEERDIPKTRQFTSLLDRNFKGTLRNPGALIGRIITSTTVCLLILCVFWQIGY